MTPHLPQLPLPLLTERLCIRDYVIADAPALAAYTCDPRYWQNQRAEAPTPQQIEQLLQTVVKEQASPQRIVYFLAATDKDTGEIIGEGVLKILNVDNRQGEIGFGIAPKHWKKSLAFEIGQALLTAAFDQLHLHRVVAYCASDNIGPIRTLEKLGMIREGLLRDVNFARGQWWSTAVYALLEQEYVKPQSPK